MRGSAVCIGLAILLAPSLAAQSVRGVVVDSSGAPVPFAIVALADSSRAVLTDAKGLFHFADLARGRYRVRVRQIGFRPVERELAARDPLAAVRDTLTLVRLVVMLETVTVGPAAACRQTGFANAGGEGVAELFEQLALNAQRWVMIKAAGPGALVTLDGGSTRVVTSGARRGEAELGGGRHRGAHDVSAGAAAVQRSQCAALGIDGHGGRRDSRFGNAESEA